MSELIWVAVPGGIDRKVEPPEAILRVVILPRLSGTTLAASGMEHWPPPALTKDTLSVQVSSSPDTEGRTIPVPPPYLQAQPGLWEEFFGQGTLVTPAQGRSRTMPEVEVTKTSEDARDIKTTFEKVASTPVSETSSAALDPVIRQELDRWSGRSRGSRRSNNGRRTRTAPTMDFHRSLALLREHPAVLRALGLILELRIKVVESQLLEDPTERFIRVLWPGTDQVPDIISPWTEFGREFFPASTTNIHAGMVTLTDEFNPPASPEEAQWEIVTVDVDNGVSRLRDAAEALQPASAAEAPESEASSEQTRATLPALRTAGLLLVRKGRGEEFAARRQTFERNAARSSMLETVLKADDLVLGYRLDISRSAGKWFSLHRRKATYHVSGSVPVTPPGHSEEGHLKAHAVVDDEDESGLLRADEVVARWSGWSLAVRQPSLNGQAGPEQPVRRIGQPFNLHWEFSVPEGSLPSLRFNSQYRIRARVADLAGGGLEFDDPAADRCATFENTYLRYEPIASPNIRLPDETEKLDPGESDRIVVIRSDGDSAAAFLSLNPGYHSNTRRSLLPPRVPLSMAEQHGMFDRQGGPDRDRDAWEQQTWEWVSNALAEDPAGGDALLPDPAAGGVCIFIRPEPGGFPPALVPRAWDEDWPALIAKQILLRERQGGVETANPLRWVEDGTLLEVSLAKAEQVTLEISCRMQDNFLDHFAIHGPLPEMFETVAQSGRHPLVTPARTVTLVHAVRRPLNDPAGVLKPQRELEQTFAILDPDPLDLSVDPRSTGQVELTAAWTEHNDEVTQKIDGAHVQTVTVYRGDEKFKEPLRHEFGDTRHRRIRYTVTAVSRFRSYFKEEEDLEAFVARTTLAEPVNILSTARPPALVVLSTRPAFVWDEFIEVRGMTRTVQRRRAGGGLRIELERPWFQTGEGEQLAVLAARDVAPPQALWPFLTQVGRDPIWVTPLLNRWPTAAMFRGQTGEPKEQTLLEAGDLKMDVVSYTPWFHEGRWYADIALPEVAEASYCPIVQLALARYQPDSLTPDLMLSKMIRTEMVPLLPERTLTVTQSGANITVMLDGLGPSGPQSNRVEAILETCTLPAGVPASAVDLIASEPPADGTPAWVAVPGQTHQSQLGSDAMQITIPQGPGAFRVRVREVELVETEPSAPQTWPMTELSERVVFVDVVHLADT